MTPRKTKPLALGALLQAWREHLQWSRQELADALGVTYGAVCHYELGRREPRVSTIDDVCEVLGLSRVQFFGGPNV